MDDANTAAGEIGVISAGTLRRNMRCCTARHDQAKGLTMRMYSPEELDVMAEAYDRVLDRVREVASIETTQRLVQEIAWAVANGIRDEDVLADVVLERINTDAV